MDPDEVGRALVAAAERTAALVTSIGDMSLSLPNSTWSVGEVTTHVAVTLAGFTSALEGADFAFRDMLPTTGTFPERIGALNAGLLAASGPAGDPASAGRLIVERAREFVATAGRLPPDRPIDTPWYGDAKMYTVATLTAVLLGEQVMHAYDMAAAAGRRWTIASRDAALVFSGMEVLMPSMVKPTAAAGGPVIYDLLVGRQSRFVVRLDRGSAVVEPAQGQRVDCHIAGHPTALLLIGYGRIHYSRAIATGRMMVWGRRPWLALRFPGSFYNP